MGNYRNRRRKLKEHDAGRDRHNRILSYTRKRRRHSPKGWSRPR